MYVSRAVASILWKTGDKAAGMGYAKVNSLRAAGSAFSQYRENLAENGAIDSRVFTLKNRGLLKERVSS